MILARVEKEDIGAIANYIIDELKSYGVNDTYGTSVKIENALLACDEAWKVEVDGTIVAFGAVERSSPVMIHVLSYYIAKEWRQTVAAYIISKKMLELMEGYTKVVYLPLTVGQVLPKRFCKDGLIDREELQQFIGRFDKRWEVAPKL